MYTVALLDIASLSLQMRQAFAALTEPECQHCLEGETFYRQTDTISIAIGAFLLEQPVGLLLASINPAFNLIQIHSLFVKEEHRNRKVATQMLSLLEKHALQQDCTLITIIYPTAEPTTPHLERLLQTQDWNSPQLFGLTCHFDGLVFNPPWLAREYLLPPHFRIFPWKDLTSEEQTILRKHQVQRVIPPPLSPFKDEEMLEPINSLGLRYHNDVVGWMITHRVSPDTIRYSALYILKEFQCRKEAIILLQHAIKLQLKSSVRWGVLDLNIARVEPSWMTFVKHRLIPYAESVRYLKQAHRKLQKTIVAEN